MLVESDFSIRYEVDRPVPISAVIDSLQAVDTLLHETADFLPSLIPGLEVEQIEIKVRSIAQESPLREVFLVALITAFQGDLEKEIPGLIDKVSGHHLPPDLDALVTVVTLIILFYGAGAVRDLVFGKSDTGPVKRKYEELVKEVAALSGNSERQVNDLLEARYGQKAPWKRMISAVGRFFRPSKSQGSAAIRVNGREIDRATVLDVPADYQVDHANEADLFRSIADANLELHAQDKDHSGQGWAAHIPGVTTKRIKLKLMAGVTAAELWGKDHVTGDVTVFYDRVGHDLVPKVINLDRLTR